MIKRSAKDGFNAFIGLVEILHQLSEPENQAILCPGTSDSWNYTSNEQLKNIYQLIEQNYQGKIVVEEVAQHLNMTESTLSRLIKKKEPAKLFGH